MTTAVRAQPRGPSFTLVDLSSIAEHRAWFIGLGVFLFIIGLFSIFVPFAASLATTVFLGWLFIIGGVVEGIHAVQNRHWGGSAWEILASILYVIAGLFMIARPVTGTVSLTL